jgi:hypothetical protein
MSRILGYHIDLDERGQFDADVRDESATDEPTIFEIHSNDDGEVDLIVAGYMRSVEDVAGLFDYLISVGIADRTDDLVQR